MLIHVSKRGLRISSPVVLSQKSIDALNSYGQLLLDKDIAITIVLFITILQNKQKVSCLSR